MPAPPPPRPPLLRRSLVRLGGLPPGVWMVLVWCAVTAYTLAKEERPGSARLVLLGDGNFIPARWPELALALGMVLWAALPRRRPLSALALLLGATITSAIALSVKDIPLLQFLAVDIALCYIAATRPRRTSVTAALMALGVLIGYAATRVLLGMPVVASTVVIVALTTVIVWLIGHSIHQSHAHAEALRAQAADRAVNAERLRIARELHDMVAHSIGIIAIQAGVGSRVIATQPAEAAKALGAIEATSRETLSGLRRMLGALRRPEPGQPAEPSPLEPAPGLADLDRLAAATTAAGVHVTVRRLGEPRSLPPEIDVSAYRIIQEAVTNVIRHAGVPYCEVSLTHQDDELTIDVTNDGSSPATAPHTPTGYGLIGMRERVTLLHGRFTAGPRPEGGFQVSARLPLPVTR
ncbi:sensor histidine kinase [Streptomyces sp. E11-3]|uniref:sensor histidine kinase n=1 Tax=Streptomyces sp. E11-3 TaxID=3110112 RepID=UPI00397F90DF